MACKAAEKSTTFDRDTYREGEGRGGAQARSLVCAELTFYHSTIHDKFRQTKTASATAQ